jgi:hypothetical protein
LQALQGGGLIGLAPIQPKTDELEKPLESGIAGFIAQLKANDKFMKSDKNDPQFSIYLSNDEASPGFMSFGGYDLKYAKKGAKESDVNWVSTAGNEAYWTMNAGGVSLGDSQFVKDN